MADFAENFDAFTPAGSTETIKPSYAMVEIFGHRQHYGEIRDVEIAGGKLLEVRDVDTEKVHMYGSAAIVSLTPLTQDEIDAHITDVKRRRDDEERWRQKYAADRQARLAAPDLDDDECPI